MHTRMTLAVGLMGASLAFAGPALAAPSPFPDAAAQHAVQVHALRPDLAATTAGPTEYVSNSGSDTNADGSENTCRISTNPCQTIQHAIDIGPLKGTIKVAAGTYPEQLSISGKALSIVGAGASTTLIQPTSLQTVNHDPDNSGPEAIIVDFENASGGGLSNLTVDGSKATEPSDNSCDLDYVGVQMVDSSGKLSSDTVTGIEEQPAYFGCQGGLGVYVANSNGTARTVTMSKLTVGSYQKNGITCDDVGTTCKISDSKVSGIGATPLTAQNGIQFWNASGAIVTGTTVQQNSYTDPYNNGTAGSYYNASGILAIDTGAMTITGDKLLDNDVNLDALEDTVDFGAGPAEGAWRITGNTVTGATNDSGQGGATPVGFGEGVGDGIDLYGATGSYTSTGGAGTNPLTVSKNHITGSADDGVALYGVTGAIIGAQYNADTISHNAHDGLYLGELVEGSGGTATTIPSASNLVGYDVLDYNASDGILADGPDSSGTQQATGNLFSHDQMKANTRYDAEDLSTGSGTAGTANTWTSDVCSPASDSNPTGLCG